MRPIDRVASWFSTQDKDEWWFRVLILGFLVGVGFVVPLMYAA